MEPIRPELIPGPSVRRLSLYLRQLESFQRGKRETISSKQLGQSLGLTDAQVRKDLAYFGQFGHPGVGYKVGDVVARVRHILGTDKTWNVILVGAGNLGRALMAYQGFDSKGFHIVAVFDNDASKVGSSYGTMKVQAMAELSQVVRENDVRLGVIAVPADDAQQVADDLIEAGVRGLLNFAPISLTVPPRVALNSVDLAVQLEQIAFAVNIGGK